MITTREINASSLLLLYCTYFQLCPSFHKKKGEIKSPISLSSECKSLAGQMELVKKEPLAGILLISLSVQKLGNIITAGSTVYLRWEENFPLGLSRTVTEGTKIGFNSFNALQKMHLLKQIITVTASTSLKKPEIVFRPKQFARSI